MKRIKFNRRTIFETHGPNHPDNPIFDQDGEYEMTDDQAQRWFTRGRAELVRDLGPDDDTPQIKGLSKKEAKEFAAVIEQKDDKKTTALAGKLNEGADKLKGAMKAGEDKP